MRRPWMVNHAEGCLAKKQAMAFLRETVAVRHLGLWISPTHFHLTELHHLKASATRVGGCE